ncbi:MAG: hypothetical protein IPM20_00140 [Gammaproteobacteria bacterium]|nr:hypothetical protein [Gammaproteobacteria bacterium]
MKKTLRNIHPGEVLLEEFLKPMEISQNALARSACRCGWRGRRGCQSSSGWVCRRITI